MDSAGSSSRILVVDDAPSILDVTSEALRLAGFEVVTGANGAEALRAARRGRFDLLILDVMLPDVDGFEVCRRLRGEGVDAPVLLLTARTSTADAARGLSLGADDYVRKPFQLDELLARVGALLRRAGPETSSDVLRFSDVTVDLRSFTAWRGKRALDLTPTELRLLEVLVRNRARILTRRQLLDLVWDDPGAVESTTIETVISRLRRKLESGGEPNLLVTRRGVGYGLLSPDVDAGGD